MRKIVQFCFAVVCITIPEIGNSALCQDGQRMSQQSFVVSSTPSAIDGALNSALLDRSSNNWQVLSMVHLLDHPNVLKTGNSGKDNGKKPNSVTILVVVGKCEYIQQVPFDQGGLSSSQSLDPSLDIPPPEQ